VGKSKIETYLGFCIRCGKIVFGVEELEKQKKGVYLILADEGLGASSQRLVEKARESLRCPMLTAKKGVLGELLHRPAVKVAALKDKNLASAVLTAVDSEPQLKLYSGGNN